ncbi:MAG: ATP-binding protein [Candidatus Atribacteria bacterium]|nr:ATP-binding protein [Candidatus Atribacteria bacterium]
MKRARIGKRFWKVEFETLPESLQKTASYQEARHYVGRLPAALENGIGFCLFGSNGVGKSSLLACILKAALRQGYSALTAEMPEIPAIMFMKKTRADEEGNFDTLEERMRQDDFVLLDDWGAEGETEFAMMSGQRVILSRVNDLKPILIACDLTPEEMTARWERAGFYRIIDRLRAVSVITLLEGENLRDREEEQVRVKLGG